MLETHTHAARRAVACAQIGCLPLHVAAANAPLEVVQALLTAYPDGVKAKNNDGESPLHLASKSNIPCYGALKEHYLSYSGWLDDGDTFKPLVRATEINAFEELSKLLDPNPRRLKRVNHLKDHALEAHTQAVNLDLERDLGAVSHMNLQRGRAHFNEPVE